MSITKSVRDRFRSRFSIDEKTDCWEWTAGKDARGYGALWVNGSVHKAHRISYEIYCGAIPGDKHILHSCDNPGCVNPGHLSQGTDKENAADRVARKRQPRGKTLPQTKLSDADVIAIRAIKGGTHVALAKQYGVHPTLICLIRTNKVRPWLLD